MVFWRVLGQKEICWFELTPQERKERGGGGVGRGGTGERVPGGAASTTFAEAATR